MRDMYLTLPKKIIKKKNLKKVEYCDTGIPGEMQDISAACRR